VENRVIPFEQSIKLELSLQIEIVFDLDSEYRVMIEPLIIVVEVSYIGLYTAEQPYELKKFDFFEQLKQLKVFNLLFKKNTSCLVELLYCEAERRVLVFGVIHLLI
jgi:hypothetical protein